MRRFRISDHKQYRKARIESEREVSEYLNIGLSTAESRRSESLIFVDHLSGPSRNRYFAIFWEKTFVGQFTISEGTTTNSLEIAYWIRSGYTGLGIATWALSKISNNLLQHPGVHFLELLIDLQNQASIRVAVKSGYVIDPTLDSPPLTPGNGERTFGRFKRLRLAPSISSLRIKESQNSF